LLRLDSASNAHLPRGGRPDSPGHADPRPGSERGCRRLTPACNGPAATAWSARQPG